MKIEFNSLPVTPLRITSRFGPRNTGIEAASAYHKGIDLGRDFSKTDTPVCSVADGVIEKNTWNDVRGWLVVINHGAFQTLYQHLKSKSPLNIGKNVTAGQQIGLMGASTKAIKGMAMHLHMELLVGGASVDPELYLKNIVKKVKDLTEEEMRKIVKEEMKQILEGRESKVAECFQEVWSDAQVLGYSDGSRPGGYTTRQEVVSMIQRSKK